MADDPASLDVWAAGAAYESYVGRWSRLVAREFVRALEAPVGGLWLDVGCGPGALAQAILAEAEPRGVVGIDGSPSFARHARATSAGLPASFLAGDARALPVKVGRFDAAVSGLVLNFVPGPERMVAEMVRAVRPRGAVALYVWDYAGGMDLLRYFWNAATALDPAAFRLDEGRRFPICAPDPLRHLFERAGVSDVTTRAVEVPTLFRDFDDLWVPFLGGQGPAPGYAMALPEERRVALRERLRADLPVQADGSIRLAARAWAVMGARPLAA